MNERINRLLSENACNVCIQLARFNGAHLVDMKILPVGKYDGISLFVEFGKNKWEIQTCIRETEYRENALDFSVRFRLVEGFAEQTCTGVRLNFNNWSRDNYVLMPAAAYNGNRFESQKVGYPPMLYNEYDQRVDIPTIISDVPRLNINDGPSRIHQMTRDLSTPGIGFHAPCASMGFWLLTCQDTPLGDTGIALEEDETRDSAFIELTAPGMRCDFRYTICDNTVPCEDRAADFNKGDDAELRFRVYFFKCPDIQTLFDRFAEIRKDVTGPVVLKHEIPFSSAWKIQEDKYNRENWEDKHGYYSVGLREDMHQDWEIGWVGGLMATHPLLQEGSEISMGRALKTFDFVFNGGQDVSGFFHGCGHKGNWYGDYFKDPEKKWHLIRKSSDALYFIIKQFLLMDELSCSSSTCIKIKREWLDGAQRCADAFVRLWRKYGQFGQFVDTGTGDIIIGNSASGGIAMAGLALAGRYFGKAEYLNVAEEAAEYYYVNFVEKGISTGGPGEILQCPDSESAFGLLESFIVLYEVTCKKHWLDKAVSMANQCITWCVSYDFRFPPESTFGRLNMRTAGSVYANVQNKHSAPGICTLSGDSLFKLYRYTGNIRYLELIQEIAHNLPQYLSREDRPIRASNGREMPAGWMNERVEMSDWLEPVGEIFYGSCWCEVSNMMTYAEIPGIYVHIDTGFICVFDNVDAEIIKNDSNSMVIRVTNPTGFKAEVKVFAEAATDMDKVLGQNAMVHCRRISAEPGAYAELLVEK
ncbi:MAG: hypothetical protein FIA99_14420 [Ruminiclostridium sp.]|nr:hypothetical protein [Ruminiclostridium sp.]